MDFATEIKERVTMFDVADRYGFDVHKKHFIHCPFHNEKTPSMKLYDGKKGCYCFGCVIQVMCLVLCRNISTLISSKHCKS
jgi:DNA primase